MSNLSNIHIKAYTAHCTAGNNASNIACFEISACIAGESINARVLSGMTSPFTLDQATTFPLQFAAATHVLIAVLQAPHSGLLAVLLDSKLAEKSNDKVLNL